jgi:2-ketocyclohexanecarboxyl-CoA hydrolase
MLEWGLINAVVPKEQLDQEVRKWADEILALSPTCIKTVKQSFRHHMDHIMDIDLHMMLAKVSPNYYETGEQLEGATAFLEKRKPNFNPWR